MSISKEERKMEKQVQAIEEIPCLIAQAQVEFEAIRFGYGSLDNPANESMNKPVRK
jgi:hypothetical protein